MWGRHRLRITAVLTLAQVILLAWSTSGEPASDSPSNSTAPACVPQHIPCYGQNACKPGPSKNEAGSATICDCGQDGGGLRSKFCYNHKPVWVAGQNTYQECKFAVGGPPNRPAGDTKLSSNECSFMELHVFCPRVGAMSGGTDIFIWGSGFKDVVSVDFANFDCMIIFSNNTLLQCVTSSTVGTDARGASLELTIRLAGGCTLEESSAFTYQYDPDVTSVSPLRSFLAGGLNVSVSGVHFDKISRPLMELTLVYKGTKYLFASICDKKDTSSMTCPAPTMAIDLNVIDADHQDTSARRRRGLRRRRDVTSQSLIDYPDVQVYVGFQMDGAHRLRNMSVLQPEFGKWKIYRDPQFTPFTGENRVLNFRPSWPDYEKTFFVYGEHILSGVTRDDYTIRLGSEPCKEVVIDDTSIKCTPPDTQPGPAPGIPTFDGLPAMTVSVGNIQAVPGFIRYDTSAWNNTKVRYAIIGVLAVLVPLIVFIAVLVAARCHHRKKEKEKDAALWKKRPAENEYVVGDYLHPKANLLTAISDDLRQQVAGCTIHNGRLDQTDIKIRGHRGAIFSGWLLDEKGNRMMTVDIKTYKDDTVPFRELRTFLEDGVKMRGFSHDNVARLVGIAINRNVPKVITPHAANGDLKAFLHAQRTLLDDEDDNLAVSPQSRDAPEEITQEQKVKFGSDIASGMAYLSDLGFVHEDLAARNCVLETDLRLKVGDAALSKDIYELDYWRAGEKLALRPVKWMAPESFDSEFFSSKSDVWSFGVTMWEIFTLGATPFSDVDNSEMKKHLRGGHRLSKPDRMPVNLFTIITHCWAKEPNKRPQFKSLLNQLEAFNRSSLSSGDSHRPGGATIETNAMVFTEAASKATRADDIVVDVEARTPNCRPASGGISTHYSDLSGGNKSTEEEELSVDTQSAGSGVETRGSETGDDKDENTAKYSDHGSTGHLSDGGSVSYRGFDDNNPVGQF